MKSGPGVTAEATQCFPVAGRDTGSSAACPDSGARLHAHPIRRGQGPLQVIRSRVEVPPTTSVQGGIMENHEHEYTPLAREESDETCDDDAETWEWCIRCGTLKLGEQIFEPGPHQKKTIQATRK